MTLHSQAGGKLPTFIPSVSGCDFPPTGCACAMNDSTAPSCHVRAWSSSISALSQTKWDTQNQVPPSQHAWENRRGDMLSSHNNSASGQVHDHGVSSVCFPLLVPSWYPMHIAASSLDKSFSALFHSTAYTTSSKYITPYRCCLDGTVTNSHSEEREEEGAEHLASN